jgi:predicted Zn-ribbon and HTH transcriptional regulator
MCTQCDYRFDREKASRCPYCGKDSIMKEKNATELLEEVETVLGGSNE